MKIWKSSNEFIILRKIKQSSQSKMKKKTMWSKGKNHLRLAVAGWKRALPFFTLDRKSLRKNICISFIVFLISSPVNFSSNVFASVGKYAFCQYLRVLEKNLAISFMNRIKTRSILTERLSVKAHNMTTWFKKVTILVWENKNKSLLINGSDLSTHRSLSGRNGTFYGTKCSQPEETY